MEKFSVKIENSFNEIKKIIESINKNKDILKEKISKIFTKIRNAINEREDEILLQVDNILFKEDIIKKYEKLPNEIKKSLEKGKILDEKWDSDDSNLNKKINDCINIENNLNYILDINNNIDKYNSQEINLTFYPEKEEEINTFLESIKKFGNVNEYELFRFKFASGTNYFITNNGLIATKNNGGASWNCVIKGDKEIPKNKISKWKIKINKDMSGNYSDIYVGIGPNKIKGNLYDQCWSFRASDSTLSLKGKNKSFNNYSGRLKQGDIIEVIVNRILGNLSFSINGKDPEMVCSNIPKEEELYPTVVLFEQNLSVELLI